MGFKTGVLLGPISFNATGTANTAIAATSNSGTVTIGNSSSGAFNIDCGTAGLNLGTTANAHATTLGSTNSTSSLALQYGTNNMTLASATGTVMNALNTGEILFPLQPAFLATLGTTDSNVTGNGATFTLGTGNALTEVFDVNSDFNTNGTFTAPATGKYRFTTSILVTGNTVATTITVALVASNRTLSVQNQRAAGSQNLGVNLSNFVDMDAADTCVVQITVAGEAADTSDIDGTATLTWYAGQLEC